MVFFIVVWADVAQRGMQSPFIVDVVDKVRQLGSDICECFVFGRVDSFYFQRFHETLSERVVVWIAATAHRSDEAALFQDPSMRTGCILASPDALLFVKRRSDFD